MKKIFQLLIDTRTGTHVVNFDPKKPIVEMEVGDVMPWFRQGDAVYNPRYVISKVFFAEDARVNGEPV